MESHGPPFQQVVAVFVLLAAALAPHTGSAPGASGSVSR